MIYKAFVLLVFLLALPLSGQQDPIKLMTYNLMYYKASDAPCTLSNNPAQRDQDLKTIVQYVQPDLMVVNELGGNPVNPPLMLSSIFNVDGETRYAYANTTNNSFSSIVNNLFYDKNRFRLKAQSVIRKDLNNYPLVRVIDVYRLYVKDPGLGQAGVDTVFFTVLAAHLKAGSSTSDKNTREATARAIMDYIDQNVQDQNILLAGDFNIQSANEAAFQRLINNGGGTFQFKDPINSLGSWNNNATYASIHTQSTHSTFGGCFSSGGMDDRYDLILSSDPLLQGNAGLHYVDYYALGQDGSFYNQSMNTQTNTSVNATVAQALYDFSDHLPVVMEMEADVSGIGMSEWQGFDQSLHIAQPFQESLVLRFRDASRSQHLQLRIHDLTGRPIYQGQSLLAAGENRLEISSADWPAGIYILQVQNANGMSISRKIYKRR